MDKLLSKFATIAKDLYPLLTRWEKDTTMKIIYCRGELGPEHFLKHLEG